MLEFSDSFYPDNISGVVLWSRKKVNLIEYFLQLTLLSFSEMYRFMFLEFVDQELHHLKCQSKFNFKICSCLPFEIMYQFVWFIFSHLQELKIQVFYAKIWL